MLNCKLLMGDGNKKGRLMLPMQKNRTRGKEEEERKKLEGFNSSLKRKKMMTLTELQKDLHRLEHNEL